MWCREERGFLKLEVWEPSLWLWELLPKPGDTTILLPYAAKLLALPCWSAYPQEQLRVAVLPCGLNHSLAWFLFLADTQGVVSPEWASGVSYEKNTDANCRNLCPTMLGLIKGTLKKSLFSNTSLQSHCVGIQVALWQSWVWAHIWQY